MIILSIMEHEGGAASHITIFLISMTIRPLIQTLLSEGQTYRRTLCNYSLYVITK